MTMKYLPLEVLFVGGLGSVFLSVTGILCGSIACLLFGCHMPRWSTAGPLVERVKVKIGHQLRFNMGQRFVEGFLKLVKIFFIQKNLKSLVRVVSTLFTFGNGQKVIVGLGRFYVKKIRSPLTRFKLSREYTVVACASLFLVFHRYTIRLFAQANIPAFTTNFQPKSWGNGTGKPYSAQVVSSACWRRQSMA